MMFKAMKGYKYFPLCLMLSSLCSGGNPTILGTKQLAESIANRLASIAKQTTAQDSIQKAYEDLLDSKAIEIKDLNGSSVIKEFASSLATLLGSKNNALLFTFFDTKDPNYGEKRSLKRDPTFLSDLPVDIYSSLFHIPTNVYRFRPDVLNYINKSKMLDPLYLKQKMEQPTLLWQYMGSPTGVFNMYPGYFWSESYDKDRYDCRRRGWFITGASSPKDVVILLDISGSMTGVNLNIATAAADILIESFQENDFFNIILFNSDTHLAISCFSGLIQSSKSNREKFRQTLFTIARPAGSGDIAKALQKGYSMLREAWKSNLTSSGCHKVLVVLSDELEQLKQAEKIMDDNRDMKVRIFTYQIGLGNKKKETMKQLACRSSGKYYELETIGDVYDTVLDYVTVLGQSIINNTEDSNKISYVPLYVDYSTKQLVTSVVVPVFKRSTTGLFAVAGQDITMSELENTVPFHKLGITGYGFSINNNGFALLHPRLRAQQSQFKFSPTVYLTALELNEKNESKTLSEQMINRSNGKLKTLNYMLLPISTRMRLMKAEMNYFFSPVNNTPFSSGIAIPEFGMKTFVLKNLTVFNLSEAITLLNETSLDSVIMMPPWPLCNISSKLPENRTSATIIYPSTKEILQYLSQYDEIPSSCNKVLLEDIFFSAKMLERVLKGKWNATRNRRNKVLSSFVSTHSGLTRVLISSPESQAGMIGNKATSEEFYGRAAGIDGNKKDSFVFDVKSNGSGDGVLIASSPVVVGSNQAVVAVVGFTIWQKAVADMMKQFSRDKKMGFNCDDYKSFGCYLVDSDGYIIAWNSNQTLMKRFFGLTEGNVMRDLVQRLIFKKYVILDEQAECSEVNEGSSNAPKITNAIFGCIYCIFQSVLSIFSGALLSIMYASNDVKAQTSATKYYNCVKEMYYFKLNATMLPYAGTAKDICQKNYTVAAVDKTNLLLIITDRRNKVCNYRDWKLDPAPIQLKNKCQNTYHYRRTLNTCVKHDTTQPKCSSTSTALCVTGNFQLILLAFFFTSVKKYLS